MTEQALPVFNIERFALHDGPGIRTTVFLQGCQLRCRWCANPESWTVGPKLMYLDKKCTGCGRCVAACPQHAVSLDPETKTAVIDRTLCTNCGRCVTACLNKARKISGEKMSVQDIYDIVIRDKDYYLQTGGGITFSGGEALLYAQALVPLLEKLNADGIAVAFETCGHVPYSSFAAVLPYTDLFLFDIKTMDPHIMKQYTGGDLDLILQNLTALAKQDPEKVIVRMPVIPGVNDGQDNIAALCRMMNDLHLKRLDLLPYHTLGLTKYQQLGMEYPFERKTPLAKEAVIPLQEFARSQGLSVTIGG